VPLPAGARAVQLRFRDRAYTSAKIVTFIALVIALGATIFGVFLDRRRRPALLT
jgi:hypothetical protein